MIPTLHAPRYQSLPAVAGSSLVTRLYLEAPASSRRASRRYRFFFPRDGNTLATALAIEPATFATTPFFLEVRFFALDFVVRAFGAALDFAFFFAITDSPTPCPFR